MFIKNHCVQHEEQDTAVDFLFPNTDTTNRVTGEKAEIVSLIWEDFPSRLNASVSEMIPNSSACLQRSREEVRLCLSSSLFPPPALIVLTCCPCFLHAAAAVPAVGTGSSSHVTWATPTACILMRSRRKEGGGEENLTLPSLTGRKRGPALGLNPASSPRFPSTSSLSSLCRNSEDEEEMGVGGIKGNEWRRREKEKGQIRWECCWSRVEGGGTGAWRDIHHCFKWLQWDGA